MKVKKTKSEFKMESYPKKPCYQQRKHISKLRCSDHALEIESGRHNKGNSRKLRDERIYIVCKNGVEDEEDFLLKCETYKSTNYNIEHLKETISFFIGDNLNTLGKYLIEKGNK